MPRKLFLSKIGRGRGQLKPNPILLVKFLDSISALRMEIHFCGNLPYGNNIIGCIGAIGECYNINTGWMMKTCHTEYIQLYKFQGGNPDIIYNNLKIKSDGSWCGQKVGNCK